MDVMNELRSMRQIGWIYLVNATLSSSTKIAMSASNASVLGFQSGCKIILCTAIGDLPISKRSFKLWTPIRTTMSRASKGLGADFPWMQWAARKIEIIMRKSFDYF